MEGVSVGLRRSTKYSFHRPIMSPVEVNSSPPPLVEDCFPPPEAPDGFPELFPDLSFYFRDRPCCCTLGLLVPISCLRSPLSQPGLIGLLLQLNSMPYFRSRPSVDGPTSFVRAAPSLVPWAKTWLPGTHLCAPTPGLAPGWGPGGAISCDVVIFFIRCFGTALSLTRHLGPVCLWRPSQEH